MADKNRTNYPKAQSRTDEFLRVLIESNANIADAIGGLALEVTAEAINLNTDTLETSNDAIQAAVESIDTKTSAKSDLHTLETSATDLVKTFAYLDAGAADERVSTITYTSPFDFPAITVVKTFVYAGSAGAYRVSTITLS